MKKNRHLIELKKVSPVLQVGAEQTLLQYVTGGFPILILTLLRIRIFTLKRMRLWFSKVAGMGIYNSLRNIKLLGFSEGWVGWDRLSQFRVCLWLRGVLVLIFTKLTEVCETS